MTNGPLYGNFYAETSTVANAANDIGVSVVSGGSAGTKGTVLELVGSTRDDWQGFWIFVRSASSRAYILDVLLGPGGGTEYKIVSDFKFKTTSALGTNYYIPVGVPAGSRVSVSLATTAASINLVIGIRGNPGHLKGYRTAFLSPVTSTTGIGTIITPTSGTDITAAAWTFITSTGDNPLKGLGIVPDEGSDASRLATSSLYEVGLGAAGAESTFFQGIFTPTFPWAPPIIIPCDIPVSTDISFRAISTSLATTVVPEVIGISFIQFS